MTVTRDYEEMHHLVDRLTPAQVRRLRTLVESDPELASSAEPERVHDDAAMRPRRLSIIGMFASGRSDISERHEELLREELNPPV